MPTLEIARCTLAIETTPPLRQYGWVVRDVTTHESLPFRSASERAHFLRLLAAYVGPAVAPAAVEDLAALLCLYHGGDEAPAHLATHHLDADYADLLAVTPLEEVDEMVGLFLEDAAAAAERADGERDQATYRRALIELIAAASRVVETWEKGDLAARVTALGALARHWDEALGLDVAGRRDERETDGGDDSDGQ